MTVYYSLPQPTFAFGEQVPNNIEELASIYLSEPSTKKSCLREPTPVHTEEPATFHSLDGIAVVPQSYADWNPTVSFSKDNQFVEGGYTPLVYQQLTTPSQQAHDASYSAGYSMQPIQYYDIGINSYAGGILDTYQSAYTSGSYSPECYSPGSYSSGSYSPQSIDCGQQTEVANGVMSSTGASMPNSYHLESCPTTVSSSSYHTAEKKQSRKRRHTDQCQVSSNAVAPSASGECAACKICNQIVSIRSMHKLVSHLVQHDERNKRYRCKCGHRASIPTGMHRHISTKHKGKEEYSAFEDMRGDTLFGYWRATMALCFPGSNVMEELERHILECEKAQSNVCVSSKKKVQAV